MSYDISLVPPACPTCGQGRGDSWTINLTHNVNGIVDACLVAGMGAIVTAGTEGTAAQIWVAALRFDEADRAWGRLDGWTGREATPLLFAALKVAEDEAREAEFLAMEPKNKWGSLENVRHTFSKLLEACRERPDHLIQARG